MSTEKTKPTEVLHSWQAREYPYYKKNFAWYFTFLAVLVLIIGFQVLQEDYFGAICLAILGVLALFYASIPPKRVEIHLSPKGAHIDNLFIPYTKMRHYWIVDNETHKTLNIETKAYFQKVLVLELADQDPEEIRNTLRDILPELEEAEPTLSQKFMRFFKY